MVRAPLKFINFISSISFGWTLQFASTNLITSSSGVLFTAFNTRLWLVELSEIIESFKFEDENGLEYEIWLQVLSRILKK